MLSAMGAIYADGNFSEMSKLIASQQEYGNLLRKTRRPLDLALKQGGSEAEVASQLIEIVELLEEIVQASLLAGRNFLIEEGELSIVASGTQ